MGIGKQRNDLEPPSDEHSISPSDNIKKEAAAVGLFEEYCGSSTIHGVRYFGDKKRHWLERLFWISAFAFALFICCQSIHDLYIKWDQSPVIVSFAEKSTPVWEIPFPAVTICPETKANMSQLNFTYVFLEMVSKLKPPYNITDKEDELMAAVAQICETHLTVGFEVGNFFTDSSITDLLRDTAPSLNDTMFMCKFRGYLIYCHEYFEEIMTEEGLCFTFNALNGSEMYNKNLSPDYSPINHKISAELWSLEKGYDPSIEIDSPTYPYRVFQSGVKRGFVVFLKLFKQHLEYICRGPIQGFKILLHTPGEVPQVSKNYFKVPLLQEVVVQVKPNMITTSESLRHLEPNRRKCYYASERKLRFLKVYTQRNCELECLSNFTLKVCGCVKFSMPRGSDTPICGAAKIDCYNLAENEMLKEKVAEGLPLAPGAGAGRVLGCNCLPACTSITYDAEVSQSPLDWISLFTAFNSSLDEFPGMQPSLLSIYFKENEFITLKRSELYSRTDFVASCGGLLGLFVGASFLSGIELFYYFSLRLCCNSRTRINRKRNNNVDDLGVPEIVVVTPTDNDKIVIYATE